MTSNASLVVVVLSVLFCLTSGFSSFDTILRKIVTAPNSNNDNNQTIIGNENGRDPEYPWCFSGRLWFRPALVKVPDLSKPSDPAPPESVSILNIFGWTVGGTVALEYDESPVGPYLEYVTMGAVVSKRGAIGQWGARLYVSTQVAEDVCKDVWNVPAKAADIQFDKSCSSGRGGSGTSLTVETAPEKTESGKKQTIVVGGWENTRILNKDEKDSPRYPKGGIPVLWTPSIKALYAPFVPLPSLQQRTGDNGENESDNLPLHRLRLSASAIRLKLCGQQPSDTLGIPIGIGLVVDNVLIEISRQDGCL